MKDSNAKFDAAIVAHLIKDPSLFRRFVAPIPNALEAGTFIGDGMRTIHRALALANLADEGGCAIEGDTTSEDAIFECKVRLEILSEISDAISCSEIVDEEQNNEAAE